MTSDEWSVALGTIATAIGLAVQLPQTYTIYKNRSVQNISLYTYILWLISGILWTIYGSLQHDMLYIVSSAFSVLMNLFILIMYCMFLPRPLPPTTLEMMVE